MRVISHRGYWRQPHERNQRVAFERSFGLGFGTETDVRDAAGTLVVSHDPPLGGEMPLSQLLAMAAAAPPGLPLALNIKADGLAGALAAALRQHPALDAFVFDMAVPDMRAYLRTGVPVFARMSEVERAPAWLAQCAGVWLDAFDGDWFGTELVADLLARTRRVCVVSPELHGREPGPRWASLRALAGHDGLLLCTDRPEEARRFLHIPETLEETPHAHQGNPV